MVYTVGNMAWHLFGYWPNLNIYLEYAVGKPGSIDQLRPPLGKIHNAVNADPGHRLLPPGEEWDYMRMVL